MKGMKGLLIKDIKLMKNMRNSLLMILVIALGMAYYLKDLSFIIVYLALLGGSFTSSTLSYDEFDKGYAFLFSLPVTKRDYVMEKYGLGLILSGGGWLLGTVLMTAAGWIRNNGAIQDNLMMGLCLLPFPLILLALLLPFHLKFGGEKGKIVMIGVAGGLLIAGVLGAKLAEKMHLDIDAVLANLSGLNMNLMTVCGIVFGLIILALSCRISMSIVRKWEF